MSNKVEKIMLLLNISSYPISKSIYYKHLLGGFALHFY